MVKERLVIDLDPELKKKFQMNCLTRNKKMSSVVVGWIESYNAKQKGSKKRAAAGTRTKRSKSVRVSKPIEPTVFESTTEQANI